MRHFVIAFPHLLVPSLAAGLIMLPTAASAQATKRIPGAALGGPGTTGVSADPAVGGAGGTPVGGAAAPAGGAGIGAGGAAGAAGTGKKGVTVGPNGKAAADTAGLAQFEQGMEFEPRNPNYRVSFSLEEADLPELVRVIGQLTGKRFIFGGKVRNIKATVFSPQKVTVAEAYQAFLSILETNGLTVVPHGRFLKIVETPGISTQTTPVYGPGQASTTEDRYVTRLHRLSHVTAQEVADVLGKFKSKDGDIAVYGPGNLVIITDTGTNIRRMMHIVEEVDVGGAGDQIWIEPIHYGAATDMASRLNEVFDLKGGGAPPPAAAGAGGKPATPGSSGGGDVHVGKIVADDRTNSLIMVATERAYLRALEFIKKIDVPHSGEGEIHVLRLQHADSVELAKTLQDIITGATQPAGGQGPKGPSVAPSIFESPIKVSADKSTNALVVTSSLRDYASLRAVVDKLDQPRRQVFIEAAIMDLQISRSNRLGMNFHGGYQADFPDGKQSLILGGLNPLKSATFPSVSDPTALQGAALGVRGPAIPGTETLSGVGVSIPAFGILINALASTGDADVLSTPHILATDNIPAEINVGQNIPLQTNIGFPSLPGIGGAAGGAAAGLSALGGLGGLGGFGGGGARTDVGTKIKITPHLNESNEVRLELIEEISEAGAALEGTAGAIPITKRTAQTQLVVKDQQTVVIGGLMRNRISNTQTKIPLLGDIPVIGALFRDSKKEMQKSNLVLVLTPYIIRDQSDLRAVFERKMQERQEFLDRYFVFNEDTDYQPPKDYSRTNGLVEEIRQSYLAMEEKRKLDALTGPRELKVHTPGQPLEMPSSARSAPASAGPATMPITPSPGAQPSPGLNIAPPPRNVPRTE